MEGSLCYHGCDSLSEAVTFSIEDVLHIAYCNYLMESIDCGNLSPDYSQQPLVTGAHKTILIYYPCFLSLNTLQCDYTVVLIFLTFKFFY